MSEVFIVKRVEKSRVEKHRFAFRRTTSMFFAVNLRIDHRIEIADPEDDIFYDGHEFPIATIGFTR